MAAMGEQTNEEKIYTNDVGAFRAVAALLLTTIPVKSIKAMIHEGLSKIETADIFKEDRTSPFLADQYYRVSQVRCHGLDLPHFPH
jgi:hypothetical protein